MFDDGSYPKPDENNKHILTDINLSVYNMVNQVLANNAVGVVRNTLLADEKYKDIATMFYVMSVHPYTHLCSVRFMCDKDDLRYMGHGLCTTASVLKCLDGVSFDAYSVEVFQRKDDQSELRS